MPLVPTTVLTSPATYLPASRSRQPPPRFRPRQSAGQRGRMGGGCLPLKYHSARREAFISLSPLLHISFRSLFFLRCPSAAPPLPLRCPAAAPPLPRPVAGLKLGHAFGSPPRNTDLLSFTVDLQTFPVFQLFGSALSEINERRVANRRFPTTKFYSNKPRPLLASL
jgi:hypothetical protein